MHSASLGTPAPAPDRLHELRLELVRRVSTYIGSGERRATAIPGFTVHRRTAPTPPCSMTYEPCLILTVQGSKRVELGGHLFHYGPSNYLLTSVALPVIAWVVDASEQSPCLALSLKLNMSVVRELLGRQESASPASSARQPALVVGAVTPELLDAFCRLMRLLDEPRDLDFLQDLIQREIIFRLLRGPDGARLRAIATLGDQSQRTARAIAWIKDNYAKPLRVEDLADLAGMGVSTLHHHFRALTAMSPLQYQKHIRLQEARTRISIHGLDIGSAALEVGYESPSQFTREYKRLFGQTPLRDVRALRSGGASALEPRPLTPPGPESPAPSGSARPA